MVQLTFILHTVAKITLLRVSHSVSLHRQRYLWADVSTPLNMPLLTHLYLCLYSFGGMHVIVRQQPLRIESLFSPCETQQSNRSPGLLTRTITIRAMPWSSRILLSCLTIKPSWANAVTHCTWRSPTCCTPFHWEIIRVCEGRWNRNLGTYLWW